MQRSNWLQMLAKGLGGEVFSSASRAVKIRRSDMSSGQPRGRSQPRRGSSGPQHLTGRLMGSCDGRFQETNERVSFGVTNCRFWEVNTFMCLKIDLISLCVSSSWHWKVAVNQFNLLQSCQHGHRLHLNVSLKKKKTLSAMSECCLPAGHVSLRGSRLEMSVCLEKDELVLCKENDFVVCSKFETSHSSRLWLLT